MPTYVYGCDDGAHERVEIVHGMTVDPVVVCETCKQRMHRIPQGGLALAWNPGEILTEWMADNYRRWRAGQPRTTEANRPGAGVAGRLANYRKKE